MTLCSNFFRRLPDCPSLRCLTAPYLERSTHKNCWSAVVSLIGYSVGLGNFWRFPYLCYKHHGGTFLIPYALSLFCIGIPLYFMELALGQYVGLAPSQLFTFMCPIFSGVGYGMVLTLVAVVIYYNVIMAWTLFYLGASFTLSVPEPWGSCNYTDMPPNCSNDSQGRLVAAKYYYNYVVLNLPKGDEISEGSNEVHWMMVLSLAVAWFLLALCLARGIRGAGKVLGFTVFYPYVILTLILGWSYDKTERTSSHSSGYTLLQVDTTYLLNNLQVWTDAATQIIYSLGIAYGGVSTIASYNTLHQNILRDTFIVCLLDTMTSVYSTFVAFSIAEYMSEDILAEQGSSTALVFIAFPALVSRMGHRSLWAMLFFLMILALGFDTQLMMVETVTTTLFDEFKLLRRFYVPCVFLICTVMFLLGIPMTLQTGKTIFDMMDKYSSLHSLLLLGFLEVIIVSYIYGFKKLMQRVKEDLMIWVPAPFYYYLAVTLMGLTPLSLFVLLCCSIYGEFQKVWSVENNFDALFVFGIVISFSVFVVVLLRALYVFCRKYYRDGFQFQNMSQLWMATANFCPEYVRNGRDANMNHAHLPEGVFHMEGL